MKSAGRSGTSPVVIEALGLLAAAGAIAIMAVICLLAFTSS